MRVTLVVDALGPQLSGIGRYTWELCKRLPRQPEVEDVRFFARGRLIDNAEIVLTGRPVPRRSRFTRWISRWRSPRLCRGSLVHGPNYFLPPEAETGVVTVHDLSVFRFPETHPPERRRHFEEDLPGSLARAAHIITDTQTVRRELMADFGIPEERITAVPLGVDSKYRPHAADEIRPLVAAWGLQPGGYGLCVSTLEPRKKIAELLRAWRCLPSHIRDRTPLVLAGGGGWLNESLHEEIRAGVAAGWLKHLGFVPEADLPALYAGASLFLYPSIYEGFGLPPLEAMASGVPVIVSNRSCLPEVCGDAGRYIDPEDPGSFSSAIGESLLDAEWRSESAQRGFDRARLFTWERCIKGTVSVYLEAAEHL